MPRACRRNETAAHARDCNMRPLDGASFVEMLQRWVAHGHITVEEGGNKALNETQLMESYSTQFDVWMRWRCGELRSLLEKMARKLNGNGCPVVGCPRITSKLNEKQLLNKAAISHMVDRKEFWVMPGKIATLTERLSGEQTQACLDGLEELGEAAWPQPDGTFDTTPAAGFAEAVQKTAAVEKKSEGRRSRRQRQLQQRRSPLRRLLRARLQVEAPRRRPTRSCCRLQSTRRSTRRRVL